MVDGEFPKSTTTVYGIGTRNPVGEIERIVRAESHTHRAEKIAASKQFNPMRCISGTVPNQRKVIDSVIAPRGNENATSKLNDRARALATWMYHSQRASQFTIPCNEWMHRRAAVDPLKPIVASFDNV